MNTTHKTSSPGFIGGVILILLGVLFFATNWLQVSVTGPLFVIAFGAMFFVGMVLGGKNVGGLAIPGSMFVMLGLILFAQSVLEHYESWAYAWTLFAVTGVGIGLVIFSWWSDKPQLKRPGYTLILIGVILFFVFGAFFEMLFGLFDSNISGSFVLPLALIALGVLMLLGRFIHWQQFIEQLPPHNESKV